MYSFFVKLINETLNKLDIETEVQLLSAPSPDLGDFCIVVNKFTRGKDPEELGKQLSEDLKIEGIDKINLFVTKG